MIAKLAYLTSPAPDRYILNIQYQGESFTHSIEISEGHLANIIADGAHYAFKKQYSTRVPFIQQDESADEHRAASGT